MNKTVITINHSTSVGTMNDRLNRPGNPRVTAVLLSNYFAGLSGGSMIGESLDLQVGEGDAVAASGTITCVQPDALSTVTIAGVVLTEGTDFMRTAYPMTPTLPQIAAADAASALSLANAINAKVSLQSLVSASSSLGIVTVSAVQKGVFGNLVSLASSDGVGLAVSAANLAGGANSTPNSFAF